ncbi:DUF397 domain-containing protein [Sphaerisporangium aureirubrum]|uniref:DUF397 domain-containing protein n=1 Tax=Sphaerisporangium aureirubrum TaxID=1544736 RepID=A0ABW1N8Q7_9ACTN
MSHPTKDLYSHDLTTATWRKSSASAAENDCVEIAGLPSSGKAIRDSKYLSMGLLRFTGAAWSDFRKAVSNSEFCASYE